MTIKTLTHIHNLLIEEQKRKKNALDVLRKAYREAEETHAPNFPSIENAYEEMRESLRETERALEDFEYHDWH